ncbi:MAG: UDP-N-acetylmuramate dehydrogenase [Desulfosalsimonadaceae bacterium]
MLMECSLTFCSALKEQVRGRVLFDEPMASHTWLRVGGPADIFVSPCDQEDFFGLVRWLIAEGAPYTLIGGGSNLLVRDRGIRGVVIDTGRALKGLLLESGPERSARLIRAMAGENLGRLCRFARENGLAGLNFAAGIPGTVGGAMVMNAGAAGGAVADVLAEAWVLFGDGSVERFPRSALRFSYRRLEIPGFEGDALHPPVIVEGCFAVRPGDRLELEQEAKTLLTERKERQPLGAASAGCFFKNPQDGEPAGRLIEKAGMKGMEVGGAQVSEKHANFIVNRGGATAADILRLMETVREAVYRKFFVALEPEVRIVGE